MNLLDLPNEILLCILNELNNIDILYSFADVNQRLNRIVFNYISIDDLDFTVNEKSQGYDQFFDRFCADILPRIHHQLNELVVEQNSMKHILLNVNYPQLDSVSLVNFQKEILFQNLTGKLFVLNKLIVLIF